jgi:hypothetical protein
VQRLWLGAPMKPTIYVLRVRVYTMLLPAITV